MRDYWLGGSHNTNADRDLADHIVTCAPHLPYVVRTHRSFLRRVVQFLVAHGVRQFLDLGSGLPVLGNVHEVAQDADPDCRVVYVDFDPEIVENGRALLSGHEQVRFALADARHTEGVLSTPECRELLDPSRPCAVLVIDLLHHIPDSDNPIQLVRDYTEALCPGSYVALSHFTHDEQLTTGLSLFDKLFGIPPSVTLREPRQLHDFLAGLEVVDPGVVPLPLWRPDSDEVHDRNPARFPVLAALGRKP